MNSKKPIQNISPLPNDESGDSVHLRQLLILFQQSENTLSFGLIVFGVLSIAGGVFCLVAADPRLKMASLPLVGFGIGFSWLGFRVLRIVRDSKALTLTALDQARVDKHTALMEDFIGVLSQLKNISTILLGIGLCGILLICLFEGFAYSAGLWLSLSLSAGIFTVTCLIIKYRLEIHLHELSRNRQPG